MKPRKKPRAGRLKGQELEDLRQACWARDKGCCVDCGQHAVYYAPHMWSNSYHMAHVRNKRMWGDNLDNVVTKCGDCHRSEHAGGKPVPSKV
jgi:5-methylcytosine-specific restriction endonuclease McrA